MRPDRDCFRLAGTAVKAHSAYAPAAMSPKTVKGNRQIRHGSRAALTLRQHAAAPAGAGEALRRRRSDMERIHVGERFSATIEQSPCFVGLSEAELRSVFVNKAGWRMVGPVDGDLSHTAFATSSSRTSRPTSTTSLYLPPCGTMPSNASAASAISAAAALSPSNTGCS